ncbi:putative Amino acid transporter [Entamoeba marina]
MFDDEKRSSLVPVLYKLEFIALIIQNIYTNTSICEGFLIDLQSTIRKNNGINVGEKMFEFMKNNSPKDYKEEIESDENKEKSFANLLDAIRNNIQGILDLLPGNLSNQLLEAIKLEKYVYDDYQIYHATMDTINTFTQAYNAKINKLDAENMQLKGEYDRLFNEQQELIQQLDSLERRFGKDEISKFSVGLEDDSLSVESEYIGRDLSVSPSSSRNSSRSRSTGVKPIAVPPDSSPALSSSSRSSPKSKSKFFKFGNKDKKKKEQK